MEGYITLDSHEHLAIVSFLWQCYRASRSIVALKRSAEKLFTCFVDIMLFLSSAAVTILSPIRTKLYRNPFSFKSRYCTLIVIVVSSTYARVMFYVYSLCQNAEEWIWNFISCSNFISPLAIIWQNKKHSPPHLLILNGFFSVVKLSDCSSL